LRHVTTGAQKDKSHEKEDRVAKGGDPPTYKRTTTQNIEVLVVWKHRIYTHSVFIPGFYSILFYYLFNYSFNSISL
jgi:hypothetical protein